MKRLFPLAALCLLAAVAGCRQSSAALIGLPASPLYVGAYLTPSDVVRIGHALDTTAAGVPVKWENRETGYQFSMMVFDSAANAGATQRQFSVLSIEPSGEAEVLNLLGETTRPNVWSIVAESPGSRVGRAVRMELDRTETPDARLLAAEEFQGFLVVE